ncbi:Outer membrane lipoprotein-sorting protein [Cyclonatronum proteinivorum]|uniref:Outer membrane lipoprotein-sorting protein n=1 Tax=Cyclonatronum proteinivorum TaxID=1457365 RepID=A0A345UJE3_9BACT|nr:outer membrane lipoprotein carrier protein LolA [Cyclonatronum proteinivorum]AXJ00595.1 Outer membrane lipoprotein-sorting protein [Cyclonatronum proteinivorum]
MHIFTAFIWMIWPLFWYGETYLPALFGPAAPFATEATAVVIPASEAADTPMVLARLGERIQAGEVFTARMQHRFLDGFTQEEVSSEGQVWVGADSYKIATDTQLISVEGRVSTVLNIQPNQLIISQYTPEEDDFAPSRFLGSYQDRFTVSRVEEEGRFTVVTLVATDPFELITLARITLDTNSLLPHEMYAEDLNENQFFITFEDGALTEAAEDTFRFTWPEAAEIIDLRE